MSDNGRLKGSAPWAGSPTEALGNRRTRASRDSGPAVPTSLEPVEDCRFVGQVRARPLRPARPSGRREFRAAPAEAPPERPAASGDGSAAGPRPDLDRLATAVWVFDVDGSRMLWANAAALEVWDAASLDELRARDFGADMSAPVARKFRQFQQDCRRPGVRFSEVCTH